MRIPGFSRPERRPADADGDIGYLERRRGESDAEFDARMTAAAAARGADVPRGAAADARREAYVEGRRDERRAETGDPPRAPAAADARRDAYDRGRRDGRHAERDDRAARREAERERRRHRHGGMGMFGVLVALVAVLGVLWLVLAARHGSFAAGGAVVDQKIAEVTSPARQAADRALDRTGQAVQRAGRNLEDQGDRIRQAAR
jgi:hypothetical protein